jgi:hypothetical protein
MGANYSSCAFLHDMRVTHTAASSRSRYLFANAGAYDYRPNGPLIPKIGLFDASNGKNGL